MTVAEMIRALSALDPTADVDAYDAINDRDFVVVSVEDDDGVVVKVVPA